MKNKRKLYAIKYTRAGGYLETAYVIASTKIEAIVNSQPPTAYTNIDITVLCDEIDIIK
jgi:muconolactone delta-isomerase